MSAIAWLLESLALAALAAGALAGALAGSSHDIRVEDVRLSEGFVVVDWSEM